MHKLFSLESPARLLITSLCSKELTLKIFETIVAFFRLIAQDKETKDADYLANVKESAERISIMWKKRFGAKSLEDKRYLHMIQHIHALEDFCLKNNLYTLEQFDMQGMSFEFHQFANQLGREHLNKIIGAYTSRHCITKAETEKRGRKGADQIQQEAEMKSTLFELKLETERKTTHEVSMPGMTIAKIEELSGRSFGKQTKEKLKESTIGYLVDKKIKEKRKELIPDRVRFPRMKCFQILARSYRHLFLRNKVKLHGKSSTKY